MVLHSNLSDLSISKSYGPPKADGIADHSAAYKLKAGLTESLNASTLDTKTVQTIRGLVLDCCQQYGIGHGGKRTSGSILEDTEC